MNNKIRESLLSTEGKSIEDIMRDGLLSKMLMENEVFLGAIQDVYMFYMMEGDKALLELDLTEQERKDKVLYFNLLRKLVSDLTLHLDRLVADAEIEQAQRDTK